MKSSPTNKPESVSLPRIRRLLCPVTMAGARLSNFAFGLKQRDDLPQGIRDLLAEHQQAWDEAIRKVPKKWRV